MEQLEREEKQRPAWLEKIKKAAEKDKKLLARIAACLLIGIILLSFGGEGGKKDEGQETAPQAPINYHEEEAALEEKLSGILSQINGAGEVAVAVTLAEGTEAIYATNSDSSVSADKTERNTELTEIADTPILVKERLPVVQGAVIAAEGAGSPLVRESLLNAATSLLGIRSSQVAVVEKKPDTQ